jgi:predicted DNA-binding protein
MEQPDGIKISVTLPPETVADIKALSVRLGVTPRELLRRAVSIEKYLDDVESKAGRVFIETADNRIFQITRE